MPRKPFITPRTAAFDKAYNPRERTAEIGAGDQLLELTVGPFSSNGKDGCRVDLSWGNEAVPVLVATRLHQVAVPTHHFGHRTNRDYFFAEEVVDALARIHRALDSKEWSADTLDEVAAALTNMGLRIEEPDNNDKE